MTKPVVIVGDKDLMRQSFIVMLTKLGFVDYEIISSYSLVEIFLGKVEDVQSVLDINPEVLLVYMGYGEMENKRQTDLLIQVMNNQVLLRKKMFLYVRSTLSAFKSKFMELYQFCVKNDYPVVDLSSKVGGSSDEI